MSESLELQRDVTPMQLMQLAIEKEGSIDVIERLAKLQMQFTDREDRIAFRNAMTMFKDNMPKIVKERIVKNKAGDEMYRVTALEDVADPVMKSLVSLGVTYRYKTADLPDGRIRVTCILGLRGTAYEEEGSTLAAPPDTEGGKSPLKAVGSTTSYLEKYTLMASVGMHVYGTDPEAVTVEGITQGEGSEHVDAIQAAETAVAAMTAWANAINAAKKFTPIDYKAMTIFTEARDARLTELKRAK
jgi:alkylhydroperoxidase/carboxymuconolactone decarboxylase family protein YurZ